MRLTKDRVINHLTTLKFTGDAMGSATSIALIDCDKGEKIWIEHSSPMGGIRGDISFTGFLLYT